MDSIIARGLTFFGVHGILPEEKEKQPFVVDLEMFLDLSVAGESDNLEDTVDYSQVFYIVESIVEQESYNLIETLAENIAAALLKDFPLSAVEVLVSKPQAPVKGKFDNSGKKNQTVSVNKYCSDKAM